jgi:hypothetical protein
MLGYKTKEEASAGACGADEAGSDDGFWDGVKMEAN